MTKDDSNKGEDRRKFMARAGKATIAAPAAALLLSVASRPSTAQAQQSSGQTPPPTTPPAPTPAPTSAPVRSDARLKQDIARVGTTAHGLGLYQFSYIGEAGLYEGVMAQEVLEVMPEAVLTDTHGMMSVYYDKIGVPFRRLN